MALMGQESVPVVDDVTRWDARETFFETIREKSSARPRGRSVAQKRPGVIVMPSDFVDKRSDRSYRNGSVRVYGYYDLERVLERMGLESLPSWDEIKTMDKDRRKDIFLGLIKEGLNSTEIAQRFDPSLKGKDVLNQLQTLGIKMSEVPGSPFYGQSYSPRKPSVEKKDQKKEERPAVAPVVADVPYHENGKKRDEEKGAAVLSGVVLGGIGLSVVKRLTTAELSSKLLAVSSLFGDTSFANDDVLYEVQIVIRETDEKAPVVVKEEKEDQGQSSAVASFR
jgi:hypothetical protein